MCETKVCKFCGQEKPLEEFNKDKKSKDGRQGYCRECQSALAKEYNKKKHNKQNPVEMKSIASSVDTISIGEKTLTRVKPTLDSFSNRELLEEIKRRGYIWSDMFIRQRVEYSKI